ncbi:MAG TPA: hypothetical protein PKC14_05005 [Candidatus Absconditabacterales bacterium]|nr:hypothetical protein [Candidatus Absconditabacterales bacterium]
MYKEPVSFQQALVLLASCIVFLICIVRWSGRIQRQAAREDVISLGVATTFKLVVLTIVTIVATIVTIVWINIGMSLSLLVFVWSIIELYLSHEYHEIRKREFNHELRHERDNFLLRRVFLRLMLAAMLIVLLRYQDSDLFF